MLLCGRFLIYKYQNGVRAYLNMDTINAIIEMIVSHRIGIIKKTLAVQ